MTEKQYVPSYVADWLCYCRMNIFDIMDAIDPRKSQLEEFAENFDSDLNLILEWVITNQKEFLRAWVVGYTTEKLVKYKVSVKGAHNNYKFLKYNKLYNYWYFSDDSLGDNFTSHHTKEALEDAGFGWVFSCEGVEVEEIR